MIHKKKLFFFGCALLLSNSVCEINAEESKTKTSKSQSTTSKATDTKQTEEKDQNKTEHKTKNLSKVQRTPLLKTKPLNNGPAPVAAIYEDYANTDEPTGPMRPCRIKYKPK